MILYQDVTFVIMACNEEYWIDYVLRPLVNTGMPIIVANCRSTDKTVDIIKTYVEAYPHQVILRDLWNIDLVEQGFIRGYLTTDPDTHWLIQVDGDEIWTPEGLQMVLNVPLKQYGKGKNRGVYVKMQNVVWRHQDGFHLADEMIRPRVHYRMADWSFEYPWELSRRPENPILLNTENPVAYHMRHLMRSSKDAETYMRMEKLAEIGEPEAGELIDLFSIIGPPRFYNPYWEILQIKNGSDTSMKGF